MASPHLQSSKSGCSADIDAAELASRDEITALQTRRLASTLAHAYDNVTHYRTAFDKAGVNPADFRQLSDLRNFPSTTKTDLRDNYPFNMFAVPREKLVRVHASSGTTGRPLVVGYTKADIEMWSDVMVRSIRAVRTTPLPMSIAPKNSNSVPSQTEPPRGTIASPNTVMTMEPVREGSRLSCSMMRASGCGICNA
jgi:hypothetical protein